jgi:hypothetical protein
MPRVPPVTTATRAIDSSFCVPVKTMFHDTGPVVK